MLFVFSCLTICINSFYKSLLTRKLWRKSEFYKDSTLNVNKDFFNLNTELAFKRAAPFIPVAFLLFAVGSKINEYNSGSPLNQQKIFVVVFFWFIFL
jgi:hypothetical protein